MNFPSRDALEKGEIIVEGRLVEASNATLFGRIHYGDELFNVIYKPIQGERPLWDFPEGTLAVREYAAYLVSEMSGLKCVPPTALRDGPFGIGSVQFWIETGDDSGLIEWAQSDDPRLRRLVLFDAIINNTDRKFGHILLHESGALFGCDHGVTFHEEEKLRTVLWQFADLPLSADEVEIVKRLELHLEASQIPELLAEREVAALKSRIHRLLKESRFPLPSEEWPAIPWPPV